MELNKIKKIFLKILAVAAILVIFFSPFLLLVDFKKFSPFVVTVWIISVVYYVFVKGK